jgi:adenosylcobinamide-GDP ribazoletransferase
MKPFVAALQFLTICPVFSRVACDERDIGRSTPWFPIVGLLIGAAAALLDRAALTFFPLPLASVVDVIALMAASGCLHADGLADTADGFLSSRPRERILEIMRDSHTGAMGVVALISVFSLKVAALSAVPIAFRPSVLLMMPFAGRSSMVVQLGMLDYARTGGLCSVFVQYLRRSDVIWTLGILAAVGWMVGGSFGLCAVGASGGGIVIFSLWCRKKIGGFTGDTLGAGCELVEVIPALLAVAWASKT